MINCPWEKINGFRSYIDFENFLKWIDEQVRVHQAEELTVLQHYMDVNCIEERWYRHISSGQVWRLVWPDPPFTGLFAPI